RLADFFRKEDSITVVAGAKCYGQRHQDVDILILGVLARGFVIPPRLLPGGLRDLPCYLSNIALTMEVKDHSPERIRVHSANQVAVFYRDKGWANASTQAFDQKYSVINFLRRQGLTPPFIATSLWLRNWPRQKLPSGDHNIIPSDLSGDDLLRLFVMENHRWLDKQKQMQGRRHYAVSFTPHDNAQAVYDAARTFRKKIEASPLDRKKVERICKRVIDDQGYVKKLGEQLLVFRGRGGAGKTVRLLQIATDLHDQFDSRVLFLTYNKALVAEVTRLFAIRGITDRLGERTVRIRSSTEYFFSLLRAWGMQPQVEPGSDFPEVEYKAAKQELLKLLELSTPQELMDDRTVCDHPDVFMWNYILVDEGQDWPREERDILYAVFGPEKVIVADGVDQFVQSQDRCDWREVRSVTTENSQIVRLRKSLRLKANLCRFVQEFAERMGVDWDMDVNDDVAGGRVVLLTGPYTKDVHDRIMATHVSSKNTPVDALFCVTGSQGADSLELPKRLESWGYDVWNGLGSTGRDAFPTKTTEYRVVKYESCRGLEGWTVVCLDFDRFFERQHAAGETRGPESLMESADEAADRFAARWVLIPMTRAIDTLVVHTTGESEVSKVLRDIGTNQADFVEVW
ncbi:MAG: hypothetical protein ACO3XP_09860, partial [Ilumatobacteraceae bacterium]